MIFKGRRLFQQTVVRMDDKPLPLHEDLFRDSPGFEWGYRGSGPLQLAKCLIFESMVETGEVEAVASAVALRYGPLFRDEFLNKVIGAKPQWIITSDAVREWLGTEPGEGV